MQPQTDADTSPSQRYTVAKAPIDRIGGLVKQVSYELGYSFTTILGKDRRQSCIRC
jgi:hypothetical protein